MRSCLSSCASECAWGRESGKHSKFTRLTAMSNAFFLPLPWLDDMSMERGDWGCPRYYLWKIELGGTKETPLVGRVRANIRESGDVRRRCHTMRAPIRMFDTLQHTNKVLPVPGVKC